MRGVAVTRLISSTWRNNAAWYLRSVFVAASLCLCSCYPAGGLYYGVSAPEGQAIGDYCRGKSGPREVLEFDRGGVFIYVAPAYGGARVGGYLDVQLWVPTGLVVSIPLEQLRIRETVSGNAIPVGAPVVYVLESGGFKKIQNSGLMNGAKYVNPLYQKSVFRVEEKFVGTMPNSFEVSFPGIEVNGKTYGGLLIQYRKQHGTWSNLLNC